MIIYSARAAHLAAVQEAAVRSARKRRGLAYTYPIGAGAVTYTSGLTHAIAAPAYTTHTIAGPAAVTYTTGLTHAVAAPVAYTAAGPVTYAAPAVLAGQTVLSAAPALRTATLTKIVNNPGHAVSYRVD